MITDEKIKCSIQQIETISFIGGGKLMLESIILAKAMGFGVHVFLSERHANETFGEASFVTQLQTCGIPFKILSNAESIDPSIFTDSLENTLGLCFGPSWIFPTSVLKRYPAGIFNFNGIPIPRYLGGAHYTWQIMNGYRETGCFIQEITPDVDKGRIFLSEVSILNDELKTPSDYFEANEDLGIRFVKIFFGMLQDRSDFYPCEFEILNSDRLYFPRLMTTENGWIDWSWTGAQIYSFCNAFSNPYSGAMTFYDGRRIHLKEVKFISDDKHTEFHPFCSGLIVRSNVESFCVAVTDGLLEVLDWSVDGSVMIKEGFRLFTDSTTLAKARLFKPRYS